MKSTQLAALFGGVIFIWTLSFVGHIGSRRSYAVLLYQSSGLRKWLSALVGGGVGAVVWAFGMGFEGAELIEALGIGSCALVTAEFACGFVRPGWSRGILWGIVGGLVVAIGGLLLFPIEDSAKHIVVTVFSLTSSGLVASALGERFGPKTADRE
jgi:hypothetical protein